MKKIIFAILVSIISSTSIFANPSGLVTEKVLKVFHEAFPEVKQPTWYSFENYYEVYFTNPDHSSCRIDYDPNGTVLSTTRYYPQENLSPAIRAKVNEKYPGKKIFGITEISNSEKLSYHIVLEDDKYWYTIESNETGNIKLENKLFKAE